MRRKVQEMKIEKNNNFANQNSVEVIEERKIRREKKFYSKSDRAITLIALVVTTIFSYYENVKSSNNKGFLLQTI